MATVGSPLAELPASPVARRAAQVCRRYSTPAFAGHSFRSYLWAAEYAAVRGLAHDEELLFVAAMVHDLGLAATWDAQLTPFEVVGAELGRVLCLGAGWQPERAARVSQVCVLHMRDAVPPTVDVESHLLQVGTSADVSGVGASAFRADFQAALFEAHPRTGFPTEFVAAFRAEAGRKPGCAAAQLLDTDWPQRMESNPLPR
jgi:hypothetical protein